MTRPHFIQFGPPIEVKPITDFYKVRISHEQYIWLWREMVGPHVEKNSKLLLESWKLLCNVYLEGLLIGHGLAKDFVPAPVAPADDEPVYY